MKHRPFSLRRSFPVGCALIPVFAAWVIGCVPPPADSVGQLVPTAPAELPDFGGRAVTVAILADRLPFSRIDATTGAAEGFDCDLISAMGSRLNFEPHFVPADQATLLADLAAGRFDLAGGGITYTLQRASQFDFASLHTLVKQRLAIRVTEDRVDTIAEFHDQTTLFVGTVPGTTAHDIAVNLFGADRVIDFDTLAAAADALATGDVAGVVLDDADLEREDARTPGVLVALPGPVGGDVLAYALPKQSDLTDALNGVFLQLREEGAIADLREKWGL